MSRRMNMRLLQCGHGRPFVSALAATGFADAMYPNNPPSSFDPLCKVVDDMIQTMK